MQVKMRTTLASATQCAQPGDEITVTDQEGRDLVDGGYAFEVAVQTSAEQQDLPVDETATALPAPETAAVEAPRRR